jgi:uncharacterized protein (TIGR03067 family)
MLARVRFRGYQWINLVVEVLLMIRMSLVLLLGGFALLLASAAPVPKERVKAPDDEKLIQGEWEVVSREYGAAGNPAVALPKVTPTKMSWVFGADNTMMLHRTTATVGSKATFKIDASKSPKEFEYKISTLATAKPYLGIYELDGDTLKICYAMANRDRPKEFKSGVGVYLYTFKRAGSGEK